MLLKKCLELRKKIFLYINYKQGWGYSKPRCSPEHSQPKDMGIFCLLGWLQMIELLCQPLYSYLLASVSGLLIMLNVLFQEHRNDSVTVYIVVVPLGTT